MRFDLHQYTIYNSGNDATHLTPGPSFFNKSWNTIRERLLSAFAKSSCKLVRARTHTHARAYAQVLLCYRGS